jgi:hypothetical protein
MCAPGEQVSVVRGDREIEEAVEAMRRAVADVRAAHALP